MNADGTDRTEVATAQDSFQSTSWQPVPYTGYPRPKGATPLRVSLVPSYYQCTSPNTTHGAPLAFPSCSPPRTTALSTTVGTPDANGASANSVGSFRLDAITGDARMTFSVSDVRCTPVTASDVCQSANAADGPDYTGDLQLATTYRLTDHDNYSQGSTVKESGTVQDLPLDSVLPISCQPTVDTTVGADCQATSTFNALIPGAFAAGDRTLLELGQIVVFNRGASGHENGFLFLTGGLFIP
jgi:hypothetical protein